MLFKSSSTSIKVQTYSKLLLWVSLIGALLLIIFFTQTKVFSQNVAKHSESMSGGNTAVIFPANQIATLTQHTESEITAIVPNNSSDGNLFVSTEDGPSNYTNFSVGTSSIPDDSSETNSWETNFSGTIITDTVWQNDILLTGDVTVNQGVTLTIDPRCNRLFQVK